MQKHFLESRTTRYTTMTPEEWERIADNPRQRDTELHAKKAIKYLTEPKPPHIEVKMGQLPDGTKWKLDGHTRCYLWQSKTIPLPDTLDVAVYYLENMKEVIEAYGWFDNANAAEKGPDVVQGAFRANGLHPQTHMLRVGRINTALRRLFRMVYDFDETTGFDFIYEAIHFFRDEIVLLDELRPTGTLFPPGIVMGVLITMKRDRMSAIEFWKLYAAERGTKEGGVMDAVQALSEAVTREKGFARGTRDVTSELFGKSIATFLAYQQGLTYVAGGSGVRSVSAPTLKKYVTVGRQLR